MPKSLYDAAVNQVLQGQGVTFTPSPADWRDNWIYFLLVDRFDNPIKAPECPTEPCGTYQGGKFAGIKNRLKYLKELGVGAIWLSPVLKNPKWFKDYWGGYGIYDFLRIEPRFCMDPDLAERDPEVANREFRELVDAAHQEGMYVILDIVINHVGDLFNYEGMRNSAPWNGGGTYSIYWRDGDGMAHGDWQDIKTVPNGSRNELIWPQELQQNDYFRRRGSYNEKGDITQGDFDRLKELVTEYRNRDSGVYPVRDSLVRAFQYLIAKFDVDGYRIDTLQFVESDFARIFGNAMREYALSIGKKNFFTFGEVWQDVDENKIAEFIGRNTSTGDGLIGVDAALDFPLRKALINVIKNNAAPSVLARQADMRREALKNIVSSHGDAGRYYVTFGDNHDLNERMTWPGWPKQTRLALSCLMTMQGVPCIYYGTEQGFDGHGDCREYVREAMWNKPNKFSQEHDFYKLIQQLTDLRDKNPALRYGRQYFRMCSGNGTDFGYSPYPGGVISFSRLLNDREIVVVANTSTTDHVTVHVVVDFNLHPDDTPWTVLFSSEPDPHSPSNTGTHGANRTVQVTLKPMEAQVLG